MADPIKFDAGSSGSSDKNIPKINLDAPAGGSFGVGGTKPASSNGGMGNIFTQSQAKKEDSKMINSIISQKEVAQKTKSILGPAPTLEKSIEQEKETRLKRKLRLYQFIMVLFFISGFATAFYFYSQLSPDFTFFGSNVTQNLTDTNSNLRKIQTQINKNNYLAAQVKLNEFSYEADRFFNSVATVNDPAVSSGDKQTALADLNESEQALPTLLSDIRTILTADIVVPTYHTEKEQVETPDQILQDTQNDLKSSLSDETKKYGQNPTAQQDIQDLKLIDNATKLVGDTSLVNTLQKISTDDFQKQLTDYSQAPDDQKLQALEAVVSKVLTSTKSDLATIANIKNNRIQWSTVISHINDETSTVHGSNFSTPELYDVQGGIIYSGYEFDTATNKIVLSGTCKTLDGSNFTLLSNLIDQLQNSPYFQNVQMRSFSKSKESETGLTGAVGYVTNFKIELNLVTGSSAKNQTINLQNNVLPSSATGAKRTDSTNQTGTASLTQQQPPLNGSAPEIPAAPVTTQEITPVIPDVSPVQSTGSTAPIPSATAPAPSLAAPPATQSSQETLFPSPNTTQASAPA